MYLSKLKLQDFKKKFNKKLRKPEEDEAKFSKVKQELSLHLKDFGHELEILKDLDIFIEGYSLCFSYTETTGNPMKIRLIWKINRLNKKYVQKMMEDFVLNDLKYDEVPKLLITDSFMYQNLAMYWPHQKQIDISTHVISQFKVDTVRQIIKHELIHYYLDVKGLEANDTSDNFIELVIKHNAYISEEKSAKDAFDKYMNNYIYS